MKFQLLGRALQRLRWRLPEQCAMGDRKAAELPKTMISDNASDCRFRRIRAQQCAVREVHSAQGEKTDRPHAQMLFAGGAKGSLCDADRCADFDEIKRPVGICLQKFLKPRHDGVVTTEASARLHGGAFGEAPHHDMDELIL